MATLKVKNNGVWERVSGGGSGGNSGSQIQSDYTQNDSSAMDYIKNRPFYAETNTIFDQDVTTELDGNTAGYVHPECVIDISTTNIGDIFYVTMEGTTYTCEYDNKLAPMIGNIYIYLKVIADSAGKTVDEVIELVFPELIGTTDTGEPFLIGFTDSVNEDGTENKTTIFMTKEAGTYHYTIEGGKIHNLDSKFLPKIDALPPVTTSNDGQILGVVNGAWATTDAPSSLPEVTTADNDKVLMVVDGAWVASSIANGDEVYY